MVFDFRKQIKTQVIAEENTSSTDEVSDITGNGLVKVRHQEPSIYVQGDGDIIMIFEKINGLITTGPTFTNVMDLHILLVG